MLSLYFQPCGCGVEGDDSSGTYEYETVRYCDYHKEATR